MLRSRSWQPLDKIDDCVHVTWYRLLREDERRFDTGTGGVGEVGRGVEVVVAFVAVAFEGNVSAVTY